MRFFLPLLILTAFITTGCASTPEENAEASEILEVEAPQSPEAAPEDARASKTPDAPELPFEYECESGAVIRAAYPSLNSARVEYKGATVEMEAAVSASGARYVGGELTWWTKGSDVGSEGTLFRDDNGEPGDIIEACAQTSDAQ